MTRLKVKKVKVALNMSSMTLLELIDFSKKVLSAMTGNAYFSLPFPALNIIHANISDLESVLSSSLYGPTATEFKLAKRKVLHNSMTQLGSYVEGIANLDPPNANTIIRSAGMEVKKDLPEKKTGFRLKLTGIPGEVKLYTSRVRYASYKWQYTTTPDNPASWITYLENDTSHALIQNLISGKRYYFRVAFVLKQLSPWSTILDTIVL